MNAIFCLYNSYIIGIDGKLPSEVIPGLKDEQAVKDDMKFFRHVTMDKVVAMGRKTWDSLGRKPLKGRLNLILTSQPHTLACENAPESYVDRNVMYLTQEQFEASWANRSDVWLIGGEQLLKKYIPVCEQIYVNNIRSFPLSPYNKLYDEISEDRLTVFDYTGLLDMIISNGFKSIDKGITYQRHIYSGIDDLDKTKLLTYSYAKDHGNGWKPTEIN